MLNLSPLPAFIAFARRSSAPSKRNLFGAVGLLALVLGGCAAQHPPEVYHAASLERAAKALAAMSEGQAVATLQRQTHDRPSMERAVVQGLVTNRIDVLKIGLENGIDPNAPIACGRFGTAHAPSIETSPLQFYHRESFMIEQVYGERNCSGSPAGGFVPKDFPRSVEALEAMIDAGAVYDQRTLDNAVVAALANSSSLPPTADGYTARGNDYVRLLDRLVEMGARADQLSRRGITGRSIFFHFTSSFHPTVVSWLMAQGIDPNQTISVGEVGAAGAARSWAALHHLANNSHHKDDSRKRQIAEIAQILIANGADVDARATWWRNAGPDGKVTDLTPLHVAMHARGDRANPHLVAALHEAGADRSARASHGMTAGEIDMAMAEQEHEAQLAARQRAAQQAQARQAQAARSKNSSANSFGQMMASVGMLAVTGAAIGSGVDPLAAAQIGGGGLLDIMTDGQAGGLNQAMSGLQQSRPSQPPTTGGAQAAGGGGFQTDSYALTCPSGASNTIPLRYKTQQCRVAMIDFAKAYACNDYTRFEQVRNTCQSACGSPDCNQQ